jgi:aspartate ammonia-lyase
MIAKDAIATGRGVAELVLEHGLLDETAPAEILKPEVLTQPTRQRNIR